MSQDTFVTSSLSDTYRSLVCHFVLAGKICVLTISQFKITIKQYNIIYSDHFLMDSLLSKFKSLLSQ